MPAKDAPEIGAEDWGSSATVRDLRALDVALDEVQRSNGASSWNTLVDLGCGYGGITTYVANKLGVAEAHGLDADDRRLAVAGERGVITHQLDLEHDRFPLDDGSADIAVSFGAFEFFVWYDHVLAETARVLREGGHLIISQPNLGSYINRLALLLGYQPRDVEVSQEILAGTLPQYRKRPLAHVHSATLRAMRELLAQHNFVVESTYGLSPDFGKGTINFFDKLFSRFPSISRRYLIVARRGAR